MVPGESVAIPVPNRSRAGEVGHNPVEPHPSVQGARLPASIGDCRREVILQIASDASQRSAHRDAVLAKHVRIADARQHQHLRRIDHARRQDHLALGTHDNALAALQIIDADCPRAFDQYACDQRVDGNIDPTSLHRRPQIGNRGAAPPAVANGPL